ncbi:hypothetical protein SISNIDRAFT_455251 [Sistotremastrum niveocremeum HHB9708]|uniref:Uncharacterized protein n=1 Tax=Sistotremastrum niveocremeum HHB9708 TaxID=1314777 RepID=A0A164TVA6_9AGAM|nr:hypothetical protein SISNIDRAFT_455251 [Sistotremastrum niveocremeum HHB9708]
MKDGSEVLIMAKALQWTDDVGRTLIKETAIPVILSDIDRNTRLEVTVTAIYKLRAMYDEPKWDERYKGLVYRLIECAIELIGEIQTDDGKLPLTIVCLTCTLLRLCWATENKDMAPRVLERVLYVEDDYRSHFHNCLHLVLSELSSLATKYEADIGVFSEFINSIFRRYISEVLGAKPSLPPSIPAQDAPDQKPQGLVDYASWEEKRDLGHRVLQILKGEDLQRRALGPEGYAFVTSVLGVPDVPRPLANDAEKSTTGLAKQPPPPKKIIGPKSRVSQAHARDPLKPSQENHEGQHSVASIGPASKKRPSPRIRNKESSAAATEEPVRKRKKSRPSAESTVIDLTLSP